MSEYNPSPTPGPTEYIELYSAFGCSNTVCDDYGDDCCAPRTEVMRCTNEDLTPYAADSDLSGTYDDFCYGGDSGRIGGFYLCCESEPPGFSKYEPTGLGVPGIAGGVSAALGFILLAAIAYARQRPTDVDALVRSTWTHGGVLTNAGRPMTDAARREATRCLDMSLMIIVYAVLYFIAAAAVVEPYILIHLPGTLIFYSSVYACVVKKHISGDTTGMACLECLFGFFSLLCIVFFILVALLAADAIPGAWIMCVFYPSFAWQLGLVSTHAKLLVTAHGNNGGSFYQRADVENNANANANAAHGVVVPTATATATSTAITGKGEIPMGVIVRGPQVQPVPTALGAEEAVAVAAPVGGKSGGKTLVQELQELKDALEAGLLTREEHDAAKAKAVSRAAAGLSS